MKRQDKFMIPLMLFLAFCSAYVVFKYDLAPSRKDKKCDSQVVLSDDELLQSYLNQAFLDKVNYDDRGGRPPKFYMIKENPTTDEILYTLKDIVENDVNTTKRISRKEYKNLIKEYERIESLDIFEALSRHYTITDISEEVIINYRWDKDKKIKYLDRHVVFPINQAIIVYDTHYDIDIYASDSFKLNRDDKCVFVKQNHLDTFYTHYKEYDIVDNNKTESFYRNHIWELKNIIAHDLAYHTADKINSEHSDEKKIFSFYGLLHKCVKIDNCGNFDYKNNFVR